MHRLIFVLIYLLAISTSYASEVSNLYQSQAPVSSRDVSERDRLTPLLLQQVMLKVVGDRNALSAADLSNLDATSQHLVQQFSYQRINQISSDLTQPDELALVVSFNQSSVDNLIKQLGLPVWGKVRPEVIVWLAYQTPANRQVVGLENAPADLIKALTRTADVRGIPMMIPLMDLQDQSLLSFDTLWQGNDELVTSASTRYGADIVLIARISQDQDAAQVHWQTEINGAKVQWQSEGDLSAAIEEGVAELTDRLSRSYRQVVTQSGSVDSLMMTVSDVMNFADFSRLMSYLKRVDSITDIRVVNLSHEQLELDISFKGNKQILQKTLALGQMLVEETLSDPSGFSHYRLAP